MEEKPQIPEFYIGKSVFVTGATGFVGKVLVWKLLHSCPLIDTIYILIRKKRGQEVSNRLMQYFDNPIFDEFRRTKGHLLQKIVPVSGDTALPDLGISDQDRSILIENTSIIIHGAALLRMDATLKDAINVNTEGTLRLLQMATEMRNLVSFIFISTAYSCCHSAVVAEKIDPMQENPKNIINTIRWLPPQLLEKITPQLIDPSPNTYIYSKRLTELVVADFAANFPIVIARPTIVIPSYKEPIAGYANNINGIVGLCLGVGKGVLRTILGDPECRPNTIPVDVVANALIAIPWVESKKTNRDKVVVYNLSALETNIYSYTEITEMLFRDLRKTPLEIMLWYPNRTPYYRNKYIYLVRWFLLQIIPAYVIDFILLVMGRKRFMVRIQKKLSQGHAVLSYFVRHQWVFKSDNVMRMKESMNSADLTVFPVTSKHVDIEKYTKDLVLGCKRFILNENIDNVTVAKRRWKMLYFLDKFVQVTILYLLIRFILTSIRYII